MQCPKPTKPVKSVWHMYSESTTLRTFQNCFKFECTKRLACERGKILTLGHNFQAQAASLSSTSSVPFFITVTCIPV